MTKTTHTNDGGVASSVRAELARRQTQQAQIAELLGLSEAAVSRRVNGFVPFRADEVRKIADFLDVPLTSLLPAKAQA